ncbi:hypothetical protein EWM64_g323 [Hericium alpestre]|uniref:Fungal-type protein kinase domain-containing protein n=1 Tax=Hericium alpestre TaxID=135208 RepID=A0A4Z0A9B9_9AGAM|nr:hypothetical protein EWM64_g323 [Hericium alpestre]
MTDNPPNNNTPLNKLLESTPLKAGSASEAASGGFDGDTFVEHLKLPLAVDVMDHQLFANIDELLAFFLSFCKSGANGGSKDEDLLRTVQKKIKSVYDDPKLKDLVKAYCNIKGDERKRYPPFVKAFNLALSLLRSVEIHGLRGANSDLDIMFHVNDPAFITSKHNGVVSKRKPDVVLTSLAGAQRACKESYTWDELAFVHELPLRKPKEQLVWADIFSSFEFKRAKVGLNVPPTKFQLDCTPVKPMKDVTKLDPSEQQELQATGRPVKKLKVATDGASLAVPASDPFSASGGTQSAGTSTSSGKRPSSDISTDLNDDLREKYLRAQIPPAVQCAMYGLERQCHAPAVNHTINVLIIDDVAWIWWYDRTGAIQSEGINFVQDLPRFIVLLFAFQRFTLEDWGINLTMNPGAINRHTISQGGIDSEKSDKSSVENQAAGVADKTSTQRAKSDDMSFELKFPDSGVIVTVDPDKVFYSSYTLVGRATRVFGVRGCTNTTRTNKPLDKDLVVKISWPSQDRRSEFAILKEIMKHAQEDPGNIKGHVPEALYSADFLASSNNIRKSKRVTVKDISGLTREWPVRVLRATVFHRLEPIMNLKSGEEFMKAWFQCVRCHYALWQRGVEHTDPSVGNLMTDPLDNNKGVLNDWDLAITRVNGKKKSPHSERTGTPPFMALDLLTKAYYDGNMTRLYRHDLEAFIWILPWVFLQYNKGTRESRVLRGWESADYGTVRDKKTGFLYSLLKVNLMEQFENEWPIARRLLNWVKSEHNRRDEAEDLRSQRGELDVGNRVTLEAQLGQTSSQSISGRRDPCQKLLSLKKRYPRRKSLRRFMKNFGK